MGILISVGSWLSANPEVVLGLLGIFGFKKFSKSSRLKKILGVVDDCFDAVEASATYSRSWLGKSKRAEFGRLCAAKLGTLGIRLTRAEMARVENYIEKKARVAPHRKGQES